MTPKLVWHRKDKKRGWVPVRVIYMGRHEYMLRARRLKERKRG